MHYTKLPQIRAKYRAQGFEVLAFPCNQFKFQEPWDHAGILRFVKKFGVNFPIFAKIYVNGSLISNSGVEPLYIWLKEQAPGTLVNTIKWNFSKFLVDHEGKAVGRWGPKDDPDEMVPKIEELLAAREKALGAFVEPESVDPQIPVYTSDDKVEPVTCSGEASVAADGTAATGAGTGAGAGSA